MTYEERYKEAEKLIQKIDIDLLIKTYRFYCVDKSNTLNGKAYYFDDFIGWMEYIKTRNG